MIGDAPGDLKAAKANELSFYPIISGNEEKSWEFFYTEVADKFRKGHYTEEYEAGFTDEFNSTLPVEPPWVTT